MKPLRLLSAVLALGLLLGCGSGEAGPATEERPPVHVTYTPDPTAMPSDLIEAMAEPSPEPDGPLKGARLYGFASYGEHFYSAILTCRLLPTEGFLGYRIESTEMCPVRNDPAVTFAQ